VFTRTFDQPAKLNLTGIEDALNPFVLPGEEFNEFDLSRFFNNSGGENMEATHSTNQFIHNLHSLVPSIGESFLDSYRSLHDE
jgi:hypothetical protein